MFQFDNKFEMYTELVGVYRTPMHYTGPVFRNWHNLSPWIAKKLWHHYIMTSHLFRHYMTSELFSNSCAQIVSISENRPCTGHLYSLMTPSDTNNLWLSLSTGLIFEIKSQYQWLSYCVTEHHMHILSEARSLLNQNMEYPELRVR